MEPTAVIISAEQFAQIIDALGAVCQAVGFSSGLLVALVVGVTWKG